MGAEEASSSFCLGVDLIESKAGGGGESAESGLRPPWWGKERTRACPGMGALEWPEGSGDQKARGVMSKGKYHGLRSTAYLH